MKYARRAKDGELIEYATKIRLRARRELGFCMAAQKAAGLMAKGVHLNGRKKGGLPVVIGGSAEDPPIDRPITLEEAGIDKHLA